jgi:hypothetical protein
VSLLILAGSEGAPSAWAASGAGISAPDTLDSRGPQITLVRPIGDDDLYLGDTDTLRWTIDEQSWSDGAPISVQVLDGTTVLLDDTVAPEPDGSYAYPWAVPDHDTPLAVMRVGATDRFGWSAADTSAAFTIHGSLTGTPDLALRDALLPAWPNPFNATTEVRFSLQAEADVTLAVYDLRGYRLARLADGHWPAGSHGVTWSGRDGAGRMVASGTYLVRFTIHDAGRRLTEVNRLSLVK